MSIVNTEAQNTGILLDAGTNELEVLVFRVGGQRFGVNVAKVREVLSISDVTSMPSAHDAIEGVTQIRDLVVSLVNLPKYLFGVTPETQQNPTDQMLLLEFSQQMIGFRVEATERIYRLSWKDIVPVPNIAGMDSPITSVIQLQGSLVSMLDFETIVAEFDLDDSPQSGDCKQSQVCDDIHNLPILYADDSKLIRARIKDELTQAGFTNLRGFQDGADTWEYLSALSESNDQKTLSTHVATLITDVEMPRMDGLTLTKNLRKNSVLQSLPVVVFSSIASKDNEKKAVQVGANSQVTKPHFGELIDVVSKLLQEAVS
ncbi:MAG: chemotaxis protein CheV [Blastopirellula sp.]|nr:MAG: chemotaxis protein CheV [Blastopirellula sp.]